MRQHTTAVVLLNLGGPGHAGEIPGFLKRLLSDPAMVPLPFPLRPLLARVVANRRSPKVARRYEAIGGASPVAVQTRLQAEALAAELGKGYTVRHAFRYSCPDAAKVVRELAARGIKNLIALPAFPQWSRTTTGSAVAELSSQAGRFGMKLTEVPAYPTSKGFLECLANLAEPFLSGAQHVLMSAHGLPARTVRNGDPYADQVRQTAGTLARMLPEGTPWSLAFQSRLGPVEWIKPYLENELRRMADRGLKCVVVLPLTFACENLETRWDLDIEMAGIARKCGIQDYRRVPAPGCHPAFIRQLAELAQAAACAL